ncbi:MAG: IclR family transcriptional regulator [Chloroflexi bacterium]|nr:MAG: IclR family transcriptional regulator [Chloroflexota bacterium]
MVLERQNGLVPAVDRAIQILNVYQSGEEAYGVSELSRRLDLNKSTVYAILNTLAHHGFVERDEVTKKYRLGPALFHLGNLVRPRVNVRDVAHPFILDLADEVNETVILGTFTADDDVLILDSAEPEFDMKVSASVGTRVPHSAGVFGKIFHAAMDARTLRRLLATKPLRAYTDRTIVDFAAYQKELARVRATGVAEEYEEYLDGVRAIGVPIVNREGQVVAALIVTGFSRHLDDAKMALLRERLPAVGRRISELLGAREWPAWNGTLAG